MIQLKDIPYFKQLQKKYSKKIKIVNSKVRERQIPRI